MSPATCTGTVATLKGSTPTGGNGSYTYRWESAQGGCNNATFQTIAGATSIDYAIPASVINNTCFRRVVTSGNCTNNSQPERLEQPDRTTPVGPTVTTIQPTCVLNTGTITVTSPSPGPGVSYSINGVSYTNTTGVFAGLAPGNYDVTARVPAGCVSPPRSVTLTGLLIPTGIITPSTGVVCAGNSQLLTVNSSTGISFQWFRNGTLITGATSNTYSATQSGVYTVSINNGVCTAMASNSASVTVNALPSGSISPTTANICTGETVTLTATGGSSYQWFRNNVQVSGATSATLIANQSGTYTVDIINEEGCRARSTNSAVVNVTPLPTGTITPSSAHLCAGSSATLTVNGGSSYQWFLNGTAITGATAASYTTQQAGTYTVRITNGGCSGPATNSVVITASSVINFNVSTTNADCITPTGSLTISNVTGGNGGGFTYSINNGTSFQAGTTFSGLAAGTYQVVVKDAAGCTSSPRAVVIQTFTSTLTATVNPTNIPCSQTTGSAIINASGGTPPYAYSINGGPSQSSNSFQNLTAGTYNVVVRDAAGCNFSISFNITAVVSTLAGTATVTDARCGAPAGAVSIQATGGSSPYTYSLDNGAFQSSNAFNNVGVGQHRVTVKDNASCTFVINFEIRRIGDIPNLVITDPAAICSTATTNLRAATITAGSDAGLTYTYWTDTTATTPLTNPAAAIAGRYFIKATNPLGCVSIKPVTIPLYAGTPGTITATGPLNACLGSAVTLRASTGTAYQWYRNDTLLPGARSATYRAMATGVYTVTIRDTLCDIFAADRVNILIFDCSDPDSKAFVPTGFTPNKNGANDVLRPMFNGITELRYFKVFNRWGQVVFQTSTMGEGWDGTIKGTPQPSETYTWVLECVDFNNQIIKRSGRTLLIR